MDKKENHSNKMSEDKGDINDVLKEPIISNNDKNITIKKINI